MQDLHWSTSWVILIIFSASGFPVIIKFQPATCNLQNIPAAHGMASEDDPLCHDLPSTTLLYVLSL